MTSEPTTLPVRDRIVVGVDGSEPSKRALRWARFLAGATGSDLLAVTAWQPVSTYGWAGAGWTAAPGDWNPAEDADKILAASVDEVFGSDRPANLVLSTVEGNAAQALLTLADGARMLVVGSRGHGGFAGLLLGSVSAASSEHATCPVLVVHGNTPPPPVGKVA
jgi:nucleotide-binding universal stress UspA family protein